jgi:ABC-type branched-subunit amino acid transport system permease subunit
VGLRVAAIVTIALLALYHLARAAAGTCTGDGCDFYIPLSLLLPLLVLIGAVVSGLMAMSAAWRDRTWLIVLSVCTLVGVIGPIAGLFIFRDAPDAFVVTSTVLVLLVPVSALAYSFTRRPTSI